MNPQTAKDSELLTYHVDMGTCHVSLYPIPFASAFSLFPRVLISIHKLPLLRDCYGPEAYCDRPITAHIVFSSSLSCLQITMIISAWSKIDWFIVMLHEQKWFHHLGGNYPSCSVSYSGIIAVSLHLQSKS